MKPRYRKVDMLIPVTKPRLGCKYHVSWGRSRGVVGTCVSIDKENMTVILIKPSTKERFKYPVKWDELRHTRTNQLKDPH